MNPSPADRTSWATVGLFLAGAFINRRSSALEMVRGGGLPVINTSVIQSDTSWRESASLVWTMCGPFYLSHSLPCVVRSLSHSHRANIDINRWTTHTVFSKHSSHSYSFLFYPCFFFIVRSYLPLFPYTLNTYLKKYRNNKMYL